MQLAAARAIQESFGMPLALGFACAFVALALAGIVYDVRFRRIPNALVLAILAAGLIFTTLADPVWPGLRTGLAGVGVGFGIWILFYVIGVMGAGDVKYFAAMSAWLGPGLAWRTSLLCALIGGVLAVGFLLRDSRLARAFRAIALAPFLRSLPAPQVSDLTALEARRQLPYGVAMGLGAILAFLFPNILGVG